MVSIFLTGGSGSMLTTMSPVGGERGREWEVPLANTLQLCISLAGRGGGTDRRTDRRRNRTGQRRERQRRRQGEERKCRRLNEAGGKLELQVKIQCERKMRGNISPGDKSGYQAVEGSPVQSPALGVLKCSSARQPTVFPPDTPKLCFLVMPQNCVSSRHRKTVSS